MHRVNTSFISLLFTFRSTKFQKALRIMYLYNPLERRSMGPDQVSWNTWKASDLYLTWGIKTTSLFQGDAFAKTLYLRGFQCTLECFFFVCFFKFLSMLMTMEWYCIDPPRNIKEAKSTMHSSSLLPLSIHWPFISHIKVERKVYNN